MKRALRLGGFASLRAAVIRALEIEAVESTSEVTADEVRVLKSVPRVFECNAAREGTSQDDRPDMTYRSRTRWQGSSKRPEKQKECWVCGKSGHFQRDCRMGKTEKPKKGNGKRSE
ncbi:uncharacterized protein LOC143175060 [Nomia melanderi]|uniref:uncharacterized protein LOC143175060 n=1 Tax=Nomia melanderi TaxID=2448451 RepID=UPI003FCEADF8